MNKLVLVIFFLTCLSSPSFAQVQAKPDEQMTRSFQALLTGVFDKNLSVVDGNFVINSQNNDQILKNTNLFVLSSEGKTIKYAHVDCFVREEIFCQELGTSRDQSLVPESMVKGVFDKNISSVNDKFVVNAQDKGQTLKESILFILSAEGKEMNFTPATCSVNQDGMFCQESGSSSDKGLNSTGYTSEEICTNPTGGETWPPCASKCQDCYAKCSEFGPPTPRCTLRCDMDFDSCNYKPWLYPHPMGDCTIQHPDWVQDPQIAVDCDFKKYIPSSPKPNPEVVCWGYYDPISKHWEFHGSCEWRY